MVNLIDALAVAPQFHLIPHNDLLQMLAVGISLNVENESGESSQNDQNDSQKEGQNDSQNDSQKELEDLKRRFDNYKMPHELRFLKPVITIDGDANEEEIEMEGDDDLGKFVNSLISANSDHIQLYEPKTEISGPELQVKVPQLPEYNLETNKEQLQEHVDFYKSEFDAELQKFSEVSRGTKRKPRFSSNQQKKLPKIDYNSVNDTKIAAIYRIIDSLEVLLDSLAEQLLINLTRVNDANRLFDVNVDYLFQVQQVCLDYLRENPDFSVGTLASRIIMLVINNSVHKRLMVDTFLHNVVRFVARAIRRNEDPGLSDVLASLSVFITGKSVDELVLSALEFMVLDFLSESLHNKTDLHEPVTNLLIQVFKNHPEQRHFILGEILQKLPQLPNLRSSAATVQTTSGLVVTVFPTVLISLFQSVEPHGFKKQEISDFLALPLNKAPLLSKNIKRAALFDTFVSQYDTVLQLVDFFLQQIVENLDSADLMQKALILLVVDDLLGLMQDPNFPAAETLVNSLWTQLSQALLSEKPLSGEAFLLEVAGKIGQSVLHHRVVTKCENVISPKMENLPLLRLCINAWFFRKNNQFSVLKAAALVGRIRNELQSNSSQNGFFWSDPNARKQILELERQANEISDDLLRFFVSGKINAVNEENTSYLAVLLTANLNQNLDVFKSVLAKCLESKKIKLSTKAVKVLSDFTRNDPEFLLSNRISQSVSRLLASNSALSREAVLELLAEYALTDEKLLQKYYKLMCRIDDPSVSVRKKTLKVMHDILSGGLDVGFEMRGFLCLQLTRALSDAEHSVRDSCNKILSSYWKASDQGRVVAELCYVVRFWISDTARLSKFIRDSLSNEALSLAHTAIEIGVDEPEVAESRFEVALFLLESTGQLLEQNDVIALQPYLIAAQLDNKAGLHALKIFRMCSEKYPAFRKNLLESIQQLLLKRLTRLDSMKLAEAVPILQKLGEALNSDNKLVNVLVASMKHLTSDPDQPKKVKLLQIMGSLGAFCEFEPFRAQILAARVGLNERETVLSLVLRFLLYFANLQEPAVRMAAVKSAFLVSRRQPRLLLTQAVLDVLDREFEQGDFKMKIAIVESINQLLKNEDAQAAKRLEHESHASTQKIDQLVFHGSETQLYVNESVCTSLSQRYLEAVLELSLRDASDLAIIAAEYIQLVVRMGFVNPKICVLTIIALAASPNAVIGKIAVGLFAYIFEKHESLANRNFGEATKLAVTYLKQVDADLFSHIGFLKTIYKTVSRGYTSKKRFVMSVCKILTCSSGTVEENRSQRDLVVFLCGNIVQVPFSLVEEVCLVMFYVEQVLSREGLEISEIITKTVGSKSGEGMKLENLQRLLLAAQTALALATLRQTLAMQYSISPATIDGFTPSRSDIELRQQPKTVLMTSFPVAELGLDLDLACPATFGPVFMRLVSFMRELAA